MSNQFQGYQRKTFPVQAARVTPLNIKELAEVCGGKIMEDGEKEGQYSRQYIKVRVAFPLNEEQTKARIGDWLVKQGRTFKVYKDKPFRSTFESTDGTPIPQLNQQDRKPVEKQEKKALPNGPTPANMPKRLAEGVPEVGDKMEGQSHSGITSETVEVPVVNPEPTSVMSDDAHVLPVSDTSPAEGEKPVSKPITLDELNDQAGDPRSTQEILSGN